MADFIFIDTDRPIKMRKPPSVLESMEKMSPVVSLHRSKDALPNASAPKLIAVLTWMAAQDVHIAKYIAAYRAMFPSSPILLIKAPYKNTIFANQAKVEVAPAVSVIKSIFASVEPEPTEIQEPQMIFHLLSNGGCLSFGHLLEAWGKNDPDTPLSLPTHVMVLDSCPGLFHWSRMHRALSQPLPAWFAPIVHVVLAFALVAYKFTEPDPVKRMRVGWALNDKGVLGAQRRRVYLYSDADKVVGSEDVEAHAEEVRETGSLEEVRLENFGGTAHVVHMRSDPDRYWSAVRDVWDGAEKTGGLVDRNSGF
ncbi:uncharacterized protein DNG_07525 [Cephalotrichum gorgonifer]|uniref:DUF829 domain-containing protein n=1 Tax=Cephalotrichum gorgonifer TaxID=2041049 RepID=A0AAE8N4T9_9PEZI|nr:uncharacterized protein DNG_07525 [Cephalotrichum gorgonifer]